MAHHVAELIVAADKAAPDERDARERLAADAILSLWDHRATVDRIDPLRDLRPILGVIKTLDPDENQWRFFGRGGEDSVVPEVYSSLRQIIVSSLFQQAQNVTKNRSKFEASDEVEILNAMEKWLSERQKAILAGTSIKPKRNARAKAKKAVPAVPEKQENDYLFEEIARARKALDGLERKLRGEPPLSGSELYEQLLEEGEATELEVVVRTIVPEKQTDLDD